jgi:hypothetical protein
MMARQPQVIVSAKDFVQRLGPFLDALDALGEAMDRLVARHPACADDVAAMRASLRAAITGWDSTREG